MSHYDWLGALAVLISLGIALYTVKPKKTLPAPNTPAVAPKQPLPAPSPAQPSPSTNPSPQATVEAPKPLSFATPKEAYHATRVLCDDAGLTVAQKNLICACIYQESRFNNAAIGRNKGSTDWGICQINDYFHIGASKDFPSVDYVLQRPEIIVAWMIGLYKTGRLALWDSYKSGAYKQWLSTSSPMWALAT